MNIKKQSKKQQQDPKAITTHYCQRNGRNAMFTYQLAKQLASV